MGSKIPYQDGRATWTATVSSSGTGTTILVPRRSLQVFRDLSDASASTTVLTDASQSWTTNQWAGYDLFLEDSATAAGQVRTIASNTGTALTVGTAFGGNIATSVYRIGKADACPPKVLFSGTSDASASGTVLTDTSFGTLVPINSLVGYALRITSGTDINEVRRIVSNTQTTITVSPAFSGGNIGTATYDVLYPSIMRPVLTSVTLSYVATGAGTLAISSASNDGNTNPTVLFNHNVGITTDGGTWTDMEAIGQPGGNIQVVTATLTGSWSVNVAGYWLDAEYPRSF